MQRGNMEENKEGEYGFIEFIEKEDLRKTLVVGGEGVYV